MEKEKKPFRSKNQKRKGSPNKRYNDRKEVKETAAKDNDASWYLVNGQLASDVANFSYNFATGDRIHLDPDITTGSGFNVTNMRFPGVCAVHTGPSIGISNGPTSPVNVAAKDIYSFVRHANSGHANYDVPDLMLYLLAADSVQTLWSYMVRAYGVARVFSQTNRYIGDALLYAMGLNAADVRSNLAQFRSFINQFAIKASVLAVPNTMTYFLRHQWMYQNVYMDEDNSKAQLYMYVPAYVYKYTINATTSAGNLIPVWINDTVNAKGILIPRTTQNGLTVGALMSLATDVLDAMLQQEDVGIMSGDILKAYTSDKLYRFAQVPDDYAIAPVFSEEVLAQFHNTDFIGPRIGIPTVKEDSSVVCTLDPDTALTITQDTSIGGGSLGFNPYAVGTIWNIYSKFIDFWKQDVTPEMSLVATRNKVHGTLVNYPVESKNGATISNSCYAIDSCGSELCIDAVIFTYDSLTNLLVGVGVCPTSDSGTAYNSSVLGSASKFNEFPLLYGINVGYYNMPVGSMSNYTVISGTELAALHNTALLSLFGVPYRW